VKCTIRKIKLLLWDWEERRDFPSKVFAERKNLDFHTLICCPIKGKNLLSDTGMPLQVEGSGYIGIRI